VQHNLKHKTFKFCKSVLPKMSIKTKWQSTLTKECFVVTKNDTINGDMCTNACYKVTESKTKINPQ
jgi:hypothetical protein